MKYWVFIGLLFFSTWVCAGTRIQVEGHGSTVDQARLNGFRNAIEQVVGQVIVSDQEARGDQLTKNFIGGYSAGYVDDYEVLETRHDGNNVIIKMNVAVSSSKIAQRMMSSGNHSLIIEGQRLQAQIDSQLEQRNRGDALISEVLSSYPYNAYIVNSGQTEINLGNRREIYFDVPYEIHWSKFWLEGINEALGVIALDSKSCNSWFTKLDNKIKLSPQSGLVTSLRESPCGQEADMRVSYKKSGSWMSQTYSYYFYDRQTLDVINDQIHTPMGRQHIGLRVDLKDAGGRIIDSRCARIDTSLFVRYTEPQFEVIAWNQQNRNIRPVINGDASVYGILRLHVRQPEMIGNVAKVNLTVEKTCT